MVIDLWISTIPHFFISLTLPFWTYSFLVPHFTIFRDELGGIGIFWELGRNYNWYWKQALLRNWWWSLYVCFWSRRLMITVYWLSGVFLVVIWKQYMIIEDIQCNCFQLIKWPFVVRKLSRNRKPRQWKIFKLLKYKLTWYKKDDLWTKPPTRAPTS